ncbi:helix-turn-helix domain-containing protein [Pseudonocardia acidicola]|uniref:Helix-turn-helix transcriptional regulator n=1 Tax=Pseudonocardia acidicola TaxID=2724939 RepID=A0ABX1S4L5_9PSEU|nr:helix-turn-helix transcriptional regulator [Pseudonocardia acidicola]NMH96030.1 helix-turn-helix transcriptional regulator [Pseudonocardia acidicola]
MAVLLREAIGGSLRRARTARRRTLREVSRRARVSLGYLSEIERGRKEPSSELLAAICEALDISLPDLVASAAEDMAAAMRLQMIVPIGQRHADLRIAGAANPLVSPQPSAPLAPSAPVARVSAAA